MGTLILILVVLVVLIAYMALTKPSQTPPAVVVQVPYYPMHQPRYQPRHYNMTDRPHHFVNNGCLIHHKMRGN
jgi:hypothetical protein